jgi:predicted nucleic acid-binding Zn ribbon protein
VNADLPARIGELLGGLSERTGIEAPIETATVWSRWGEIVGADIATHAEPTSLKGGILRVRAETPTWATEIGYLGDEILRRTNAVLGAPVVTEVRVWTGPGPAAGFPTQRHDLGRSRRRAVKRDEGTEGDPVTVFRRARAAWSRRRNGRSPGAS